MRLSEAGRFLAGRSCRPRMNQSRSLCLLQGIFVLACLVAVQNKVKAAKAKGRPQEVASGCDGSCASCGNGSCGKAVFSVEKQEGK